MLTDPLFPILFAALGVYVLALVIITWLDGV